jgi:hypothetical protein
MFENIKELSIKDYTEEVQNRLIKFRLSGFGQSLVGSQEIKLQPAPTNTVYQIHPETSLCI